MVNKLFNTKEPLDQEWVELILDALEQGLTVSEIRTFLEGKKVQSL